MISRRQAREWALQLLVQLDLNPVSPWESVLEDFWQQLREIEAEALLKNKRLVPRLNFKPTSASKTAQFARARAFAEEHVRGVREHLDELDQKLEEHLRNWSLYRLGTVERNTLRLGLWELLNCPDVPGPIVVNEYVDLAKFFCETKSGRFVNAVLQVLAKELGRDGVLETEGTPAL